MANEEFQATVLQQLKNLTEEQKEVRKDPARLGSRINNIYLSLNTPLVD